MFFRIPTSARFLFGVLALGITLAYPLSAPHAQAFDPTRSLFAAAANGNLSAAQASLAAGADIHAKNATGLTAAEIAVDKGHFKIAHYLVSVRDGKTDGAKTNPDFTIATPPSPTETAQRHQPMATAPTGHTAPPGTAALTAKPGSAGAFDPNTPLTPGIAGAPTAMARPTVPAATATPPSPAFMDRLNTTLTAPSPTAPATAGAPEQVAAMTPADKAAAQAKGQAVEQEGMINRFFDKMTTFFSTGDPDTLAPDNLAQPVRTAARPEQFASMNLQVGQAGQGQRTGALRIGKEGRLNRKAPPTEFGVKLPCINKRRDSVTVCVENVTWPDGIASHFGTDSILYKGHKMITRYNQGRAAFIHVVFPSRSYQEIVRYFVQVYGHPTETWTRTVAPLGEPRRGNPVQVWFGTDPDTKKAVFLEVRQYDDARGDFPDMEQGAVLLHYEDATPIFPLVSKIELMLIR